MNPFTPESAETCTTLRENLFLLRSGLRNPDIKLVRERSIVLAHLSLHEYAKNIKRLSTPREKMDILISSELLVNEQEILQFVKKIDGLDIIGIRCRNLEETISPGAGEGLFYADFHRVGEDFAAYLVFNIEEKNQLDMVFVPNSGPIDEYDRETILSLLGHASKSAVNEDVKAAIP